MAENSTLPFPQNEPKHLGAWTIPREEGSSSAPEATPTLNGHCERNTQRQKPERLPPTCPPLISRGSPLSDWRSGLPLPWPLPEPSLLFQTSVPTALANTASRLGPLEPYHRTMPALSWETLSIPLATHLQNMRNLKAPEDIPLPGASLHTQGPSDTS